MEPIYQKEFEVTDMFVDCYGRMKPSKILFLAQDIAGLHSAELGLDYDTLAAKRLFWAVTRHRVQITRLPKSGEKLRVETWPMPATRVAYPRSMVAYDEQGMECFRSISLWVLMNLDTRNMILPGKSGISVLGTIRGTELPSPGGLMVLHTGSSQERSVCFTDLDRNGHMNNTRCMDWIDDLMPSVFHAGHIVKEFTVCYFSEAKEGQRLLLNWELGEENTLQVDAHRFVEDNDQRVFSAKILYE